MNELGQRIASPDVCLGKEAIRLGPTLQVPPDDDSSLQHANKQRPARPVNPLWLASLGIPLARSSVRVP